MSYLESLDGTQSYLASLFCNKKDLEHNKVYTLEELGFCDWLIAARTKYKHKPPQKKLIYKKY